jgi:hypothetical protein
MALAILIGFSYSGKFSLPGIIVDLYLVYQYCRRCHFDKIIVITDIQCDPVDMTTLVIDNVVDINIFTFITDLKSEKSYLLFNPFQFQEQLTKVLSHGKHIGSDNLNGNYDKLFFYYTGHGLNGGLRLPDLTILTTETLRKIIFRRNDSSEDNWKKIFCLFDCCHADGLKLPFHLMETPNGQLRYYLNDIDNLISPEIICLVSTNQDEKTVISTYGSHFTRFIIDLLKKNCRKIKSLYQQFHQFRRKSIFSTGSSLDNILSGCPRNLKIYASYPNLYEIWDWCFFKKRDVIKTSRYLRISVENHAVIVEKNNNSSDFSG